MLLLLFSLAVSSHSPPAVDPPNNKQQYTTAASACCALSSKFVFRVVSLPSYLHCRRNQQNSCELCGIHGKNFEPSQSATWRGKAGAHSTFPPRFNSCTPHTAFHVSLCDLVVATLNSYSECSCFQLTMDDESISTRSIVCYCC